MRQPSPSRREAASTYHQSTEHSLSATQPEDTVPLRPQNNLPRSEADRDPHLGHSAEQFESVNIRAHKVTQRLCVRRPGVRVVARPEHHYKQLDVVSLSGYRIDNLGFSARVVDKDLFPVAVYGCKSSDSRPPGGSRPVHDRKMFNYHVHVPGGVQRLARFRAAFPYSAVVECGVVGEHFGMRGPEVARPRECRR